MNRATARAYLPGGQVCPYMYEFAYGIFSALAPFRLPHVRAHRQCEQGDRKGRPYMYGFTHRILAR
jgi:hypothetical protein